MYEQLLLDGVVAGVFILATSARDTARNLLVKELAIAKSHSEDKIMEELKTIFAH